MFNNAFLCRVLHVCVGKWTLLSRTLTVALIYDFLCFVDFYFYFLYEFYIKKNLSMLPHVSARVYKFFNENKYWRKKSISFKSLNVLSERRFSLVTNLRNLLKFILVIFLIQLLDLLFFQSLPLQLLLHLIKKRSYYFPYLNVLFMKIHSIYLKSILRKKTSSHLSKWQQINLLLKIWWTVLLIKSKYQEIRNNKYFIIRLASDYILYAYECDFSRFRSELVTSTLQYCTVG